MGIHGKSVQTELAYEAIKVLAPYVAERSMVPAWIPALKHVEKPSGERPELAMVEERVPVVLEVLRSGRGTTTLPWTEIGTLLQRNLIRAALHRRTLPWPMPPSAPPAQSPTPCRGYWSSALSRTRPVDGWQFVNVWT